MITPERYQRAVELFHHVCQLPFERRPEFLRQACGQDAELLREVESLLTHDSATRPAGDAIDVGRGAELLAAELRLNQGEGVAGPGDKLPERVGNYRILRLIGHGGMGAVYEAEQENPKRRVALKMVRPGLGGEQLLGRLRREAYVLGRLQHPGIGQVYEAGFTDAGGRRQPYFAMEFIDGLPLDRFADQRGLCARSRMELVARACEAIHYAHERGVIHRDLKPGNILVVAERGIGQDGQGLQSLSCGDAPPCGAQLQCAGQPKVLDFGVARLTDADLQVVTLQTEVGQLVGTMSYMSPEQVTGRPDALDHRSDVYSMGVILHELLSGRLPHDIRNRTIPEAASIIRDGEPSLLGSINTQYRGDIETIVGKALEKDPQRRYQTAAELAADIRRFLNDEPILARPATTLYQFRKFARRNRGLVGGLAATLVALIVGLVSTSYFLVEALRQRDAAEEERARTAEVAAFQADLLEDLTARKFGSALLEDLRSEFRRALDKAGLDEDEVAAEGAAFEGMLERINSTNLGRTALSGSLANRALRRIEAGVSDDPITEARLREAVGGIYRQLGMYSEAAEQFEKTIDLYRTHRSPDHEDTITATSRAARMYREMGRVAEAEAKLRDVLERRRRLVGDGDEQTLRAQGNLAGLLRLKGELDEAAELLRLTLEGFERLSGPDSPAAMNQLNTYCAVLLEQSKVEEALQCFQRALKTRERVSGADHPRTITVRNNVMAALFKAHRFEDAIPIARDVLATSRRVHGDDHPRTILARNNLGRLLLDLGSVDEAESLFRSAVAGSRAQLNPENEVRMKSISNLIDVLLARERPVEAEPLCHELIDERRRLRPEQPGLVAQTLEQLGDALYQQQRFGEARDAWRECADLRAGIDSDHWLTNRARSKLGGALTALGEFEKAEKTLLDSYAALESQRDAIPLVAGAGCVENARARLVALYEHWKKQDQAERWRNRGDQSSPQ